MNRVGQSIRVDSPEFLAPADSVLDKAPAIADPDGLLLQDDPLLAKVPEEDVAVDKEDHVAGNFKYFKEGYREPLLPTAPNEKGLQATGTDDLGMNSRKSNAFDPAESDIAGPSGALGELQRQHKLREKYNLKHAVKLDPYEKHDYASSKSDGGDDEASESIIRYEAAPLPPPDSHNP